MPWETLEETYDPQYNPTTGALAKPVMLAFGELFIKQRLGLTDEETVDKIRENAYLGTTEKAKSTAAQLVSAIEIR